MTGFVCLFLLKAGTKHFPHRFRISLGSLTLPIPVKSAILLTRRSESDVFVHIIQHLCAPQAIVDLGGGVSSDTQSMETKVIFGMRFECLFDGIFYHMGGNEQDAAGGTEHDIARQADGLINTARSVDTIALRDHGLPFEV